MLQNVSSEQWLPARRPCLRDVIHVPFQSLSSTNTRNTIHCLSFFTRIKDQICQSSINQIYHAPHPHPTKHQKFNNHHIAYPITIIGGCKHQNMRYIHNQSLHILRTEQKLGGYQQKHHKMQIILHLWLTLLDVQNVPSHHQSHQ